MKNYFRSGVESGFTLIEIMAVIFIIGVMLGLVAVTFSGQAQRRMNNEAQRLYQKLRLVNEEAEYSGSEYGMGLTRDRKGYQFYRFDEQIMDWVKLDKDFFKSVEMDEGYQLNLDTSENKLDATVMRVKPTQAEVTKYGEKKTDTPDIVFFSDGEVTPFKLSLSNAQLGKLVYVIRADNQSELSVQARE